jgi:hypothetical protein
MTRARSRLRDRRRGGLCRRCDHGRRLGRDDGKGSGRRGMSHRGCRDRAGRRHVGIQRDQAGHHQAADHHEIFQDKHHQPLGPQGPPQSLVAATVGLVQSNPRSEVALSALGEVGGGGNGFEPPSRAVHTRALPIELPCRRTRQRRSVQNCSPSKIGSSLPMRRRSRPIGYRSMRSAPPAYRSGALGTINAMAARRPNRVRPMSSRPRFQRLCLPGRAALVPLQLQ